MVLPGLESNPSRQSGYSVPYPPSNSCCCCHCYSNCGSPVRRFSYWRCHITELSDDITNDSTNVAEDNTIQNGVNRGRNPCTDIVPLYPSEARTPRSSDAVNRSSSNTRNGENSVSLLNYTRHQGFDTDQRDSPEQNNQITPNIHDGNDSTSNAPNRPNRHNSCHLHNRRCHHNYHHYPQRHRARTRSMRSRTGLATMMPLSAWNLRHLQYPLPLEPPPPYRPWQLPPYLEDDPAPSYRSRATTPANSVCGALE